MNDPYWLRVAKELPVGRSRKVKCCSGDTSASASSLVNGYSLYCFRCGGKEFIPRGTMGLSELHRVRREMELVHTRKLADISTYTSLYDDVPDKFREWYLEYGVPTADLHFNGWLYSEQLDRIMIPVYDREELLGVQGRSVDRKPKYLNSGAIESTVYRPHWKRKMPFVVMVEDALSAVKIARVCPVVATLGTTLNDTQILQVIATGRKPILWYDNDAAGHKAVKKAESKFNLMGIPYGVINTKDDPKCYSRGKIETEILNA